MIPASDPVGEAAIPLPPLQARRKAIYESYRLEFLPDGYPGRRIDEEVVAHPLYGTYVIADYLSQYGSGHRPEYLAAATRVADAALARMTPHEDALVYWYEPDQGISSLPHCFYSALTQARWLDVLGKLHEASGDGRYGEAAAAVFRSLTVPVERGGVLRTHGAGVVLEEYVHDVPDYTQNGWTTALLLVHGYYARTRSAQVLDFFEKNLLALADVLPLYDVPELANSRYRLSGPAKIRIEFSAPECVIQLGAVAVPGQGTYPVRREPRRWSNHYRSGVAADGTVDPRRRTVIAEVLLSMLSVPTRNRLELSVATAEDCTVHVAIGQGEYRPLVSQLMVTSFADVATVKVGAGDTDLAIDIPWHLADLVAYPTSFGKKIASRKYNSYHFIHVANLEKLFALTGNPIFQFYADRWGHYPERWPQMAEYNEPGLALTRYRAGSEQDAG